MTAADGDWLVADELAPDPSGTLRSLFEQAALGELVMPSVTTAARPLELEQFACDACGGRVASRRVDPSGTVRAVTTVHRREPRVDTSDETVPCHRRRARQWPPSDHDHDDTGCRATAHRPAGSAVLSHHR